MIDDDKFQTAFEERMGLMQQEVDKAVGETGRESVVVYSAYDNNDSENLPISNLHKVPVDGFVVFYSPRNIPFGGHGSKPYWSPLLFHPSYLEIAVLANQAILRTRDFSHRFFEGVREIRPQSLILVERLAVKFGRDTKFYKLCFSS